MRRTAKKEAARRNNEPHKPSSANSENRMQDSKNESASSMHYVNGASSPNQGVTLGALSLEDWDSECDHVTDGGNGQPEAWCDKNVHQPAEILEGWRVSLNGRVYRPESRGEWERLWKRRLKRDAWDRLKADPEYHKADLTFEDVFRPLGNEMRAMLESTRSNTAYAAFLPPPWWTPEQMEHALSVLCEAAWLDFCQYDRNARLLDQQAKMPEPPKPQKRGTLTVSVIPKAVEWLWPNRIPIGKLCDIQGDPGTGKSAITADIAAIISNGGNWPTGEPCEAGGVIMINGEEDLEDGIVPHLIAAGANRRRIKAYTLHDEPLFELPRDLDLLEEDVKEMKARAIMIDPLDCFVSEDVELNKNQQIRRQVLAALARMAAEHKFAVIIVRHLNKDAKTRVAMYRGTGSIGLNAASRAVWMVGASPLDKSLKVMAMVKISNAPPQRSLSYELEQVIIKGAKDEDIKTLRVRWAGEVDVAASQLLVEADGRTSASRTFNGDKAVACKDLLRELLADGAEHPAKEIETAIKERIGVSHSTIFNAKEELQVRARKQGIAGGWLWYMPISPLEELSKS